jgi:peptide/nickel transport system permease protein
VTLISFVLMVYFGPDKTYELLGKNPTQQQIDEIRHQLGYDQPFIARYGQYLKELGTLDFGHSDSTGERVTEILSKTIPISIYLALPGFILGNLIAILLSLVAAFNRSGFWDKFIMTNSVIGMSISLLIVTIGFQIIFCSTFFLGWFPVQGWDVTGFWSYLEYVTVPTMITVFVALGYNTRFYRAVFVEELTRDHVRTARAFGCPTWELLLKHVLRNSMIPIITRIIYTVPFVLIGGSLVVESYFGIPGVGLITYDAITSGDQPILKAVVALTAVFYVLVITVTDILYRMVDPRISLR